MNDLFAMLGLQQPNFSELAQPTLEELQANQLGRLQSVLDQMTPEEQNKFTEQLVKNLQVVGGAQDFTSDPITGFSYGGKINYNLPIDETSVISAGITGGGSRVKTPIGTFKQSEITGGDINYRFGPNDISLAYTAKGARPIELSSPQNYRQELNPNDFQAIRNLLQLIYRREF